MYKCLQKTLYCKGLENCNEINAVPAGSVAPDGRLKMSVCFIIETPELRAIVFK